MQVKVAPDPRLVPVSLCRQSHVFVVQMVVCVQFRVFIRHLGQPRATAHLHAHFLTWENGSKC